MKQTCGRSTDDFAETDNLNIPSSSLPQNLLEKHRAAAYFAATFAVSWTAALLVASPHLLRHEALPKLTGILMFPAMLLGPSLTGILLTRMTDGKAGVRKLFSRMARWRVEPKWYAALAIAPVLVLTVLLCLKTFVSSDYTPNLFWIGVLFGVPAGILEEIGWMGYAFPKMHARTNAQASAILLGLLWSAWHLPVINFLGTATPHGDYWFPFFLTFAAAMTAMRVLICWVYSHTGSVLLAQLMHVTSTGSLVIFSAPHVTARQEALWYGLYALALWVVVGVVLKALGGFPDPSKVNCPLRA